ncbi:MULTISPECIES: phage virion morphogenesis protein [unclassified Thioalkalivibrio]|uniref:phage virion morphogenesis protein n=1 Tax=unclassified Thioalkalivibrio TaxID=2621013 RepID=UPI000372A2C3|nr:MULTISPECIES: phage virion morphogenesis protein [unclassified Thioalkalivibrio]
MITGTAHIEDQTVGLALDRLARMTANPRPALQAINRRLLTLIQDGFRTGTDPWGRQWAPLAVRQGQPLRDTGRLRNSFTGYATASEAVVGTNVCYALVHQFGATIHAQRPSGNNVCGYTPKGSPFLTFKVPGGYARKKSVEIPRRAMLPISESGQATLPDRWASEVLDTLHRHMENAL